MIQSLLKESTKLRNAFIKRWEKLTQQEVADDAKLLGWSSITRQAVSRYINKPYSPGALNDEQIVFLAIRWGIGIRLEIGEPNGKVTYIVPEKFDNKASLLKAKEIWPNTTLPTEEEIKKMFYPYKKKK